MTRSGQNQPLEGTSNLVLHWQFPRGKMLQLFFARSDYMRSLLPVLIANALSKIRLAAFFLSMLSVLCFSTAHAQLLKYNNEAELFGAAAVSPDSGFQVLQKLIGLCLTYSPSLQSFGEQELKKWVSRHRSYLEENAASRQELIEMLNSPSMTAETKKNIKNMLEVYGPKMIDSQFETIRISIKGISSQEGQASLCSDYIQSIADGKFDLRKNDPSLSAYLDQRISKRGKKIATSSPTVDSHQVSADRLIVGRWRHISLLRTLDGKTVAPQATDGKSIVEFFPNGTWTLATSKNHSAGKYRWLDADHVEQTVLESGLAMQIGVVTIQQVRVSAEDLEIIAVHTKAEMDKLMPAAKPGVRRPNEVVVTSVFSREMNSGH
ncbi:hypothetical protein CFter6_4247 [Collimonas fungivorans]|uniref:Uncharacterized protein n=1 Tax=Collimonas fungivorans TaxID=158899 RepID=A0A127PGC6_9BURK|nr:hypothetical protein [Collimonas fungivorans]AMO96848.1 hypothetical protein CFter6_4247 [Collimonas fungivorans]